MIVQQRPLNLNSDESYRDKEISWVVTNMTIIF